MKLQIAAALIVLAGLGVAVSWGQAESEKAKFDPKKDLISLHYDHAPDKDDGHSAAADRSMLQTMFGPAWMSEHAIGVSGAYGLNKKKFNSKSDAVMDAVFGAGQWIAADADWDKAVASVYERWAKVLAGGGDVWVKEGGQSDITTAVVKIIHEKHPDIQTTRRIHVVQHSGWNEKATTPEALAFAKEHTDYIKIKDANRYLNKQGGDEVFEKAALSHPTFGPSWKAAFEYYSPRERLDFSDTGELMHILNLGEMGIDAFREKYLEVKE